MSVSKFLLTTCLIFISLLKGYGQEYTPFYLDNAKWTMQTISPVIGSEDGQSYWEIYTLDDTLVADQVYRKIVVRNICELWPNFEGNLQLNTTINTNEYLLGGLREEDQRVYFLKFDQEPSWRLLQSKVNQFNPEEEYLLYDFNIVLGDTTQYSDLDFFTVSNGDTSFFTSSHFTITDEELSVIESLRRYEIRSSSAFAFPNETGVLTEGIGSSYGLLGSYDSFLTYLVCFSVDGETILYDGNCNPCEGFVSTSEPDEFDEVVVYPNPVDGILNIKRSGTLAIEDIRITDGFGRLVFENSYSENLETIQVNLSGSPSGLLILEIGFENGKRAIEKVIVGR